MIHVASSLICLLPQSINTVILGQFDRKSLVCTNSKLATLCNHRGPIMYSFSILFVIIQLLLLTYKKFTCNIESPTFSNWLNFVSVVKCIHNVIDPFLNTLALLRSLVLTFSFPKDQVSFYHKVDLSLQITKFEDIMSKCTFLDKYLTFDLVWKDKVSWM